MEEIISSSSLLSISVSDESLEWVFLKLKNCRFTTISRFSDIIIIIIIILMMSSLYLASHFCVWRHFHFHSPIVQVAREQLLTYLLCRETCTNFSELRREVNYLITNCRCFFCVNIANFLLLVGVRRKS